MIIKLLLLTSILITFSCQNQILVEGLPERQNSLETIGSGQAPMANTITPTNFNEDVESIITLSYSDNESDPALTCQTSNLTNIIITASCACDLTGICTVGVTGNQNYNGAGIFSYKVSTGDQSSNLADAAFTILPVNDIPDLLTNTGKSIPEGISYIIKNTELNSSDVEDSSSNITYTIETAPRNGELKLDGVTLNVNDNFRQSDINNSTLTYLHTALNTDDDSFQFSVQDSSAAEAIGATTSTPATFAIIITIDLCLHSSETFTNNSIFTMPANCYSITLKMWGGGGGGSPAYEDLGMGGQGGPGGYTGLSRATIPGTIYQIKIGAGGRGGQNNEINCGSTGGVGTDTFSGGNGGEPRSDGGDGEGLPDRPTLGGGGAEEAKELNTIQGGSGCGGTGASAIISGNAGAGSGGDCLGDDNLQGAGRIPAHSALADRSAEGGTAGKYDSCDSLNGGDGKVIISY